MPKRDVVSWTTAISWLCTQRDWGGRLEIHCYLHFQIPVANAIIKDSQKLKVDNAERLAQELHLYFSTDCFLAQNDHTNSYVLFE